MLEIRWIRSLQAVNKLEWNALAALCVSPYLQWDWLEAMESSGSIGEETGWEVCHLLVYHSGVLVAAAPCYLKWHSSGDFNWDFSWAQAAEQAGINYYPKLAACIPATPSGRYQFMVKPEFDYSQMVNYMLSVMQAYAQMRGAASFQILFPEATFEQVLKKRSDFACQTMPRFDWCSQSHTSFDAYLSTFSKNQRRNIRRERESLTASSCVVQVLTGAQLVQAVQQHGMAELVWRCYLHTNEQFGPWAARFLEQGFFERILLGMADSVLLFVASQRGQHPVRNAFAMSLLVYKADLLFGRWWGSLQEQANLHFELCYYAPIEWALEQGIRHFDPGAGSSHKIRRGFLVEADCLYHHFLHPGLHQAIAQALPFINQQAELEIKQLNTTSPLKHLHDLTS